MKNEVFEIPYRAELCYMKNKGGDIAGGGALYWYGGFAYCN